MARCRTQQVGIGAAVKSMRFYVALLAIVPGVVSLEASAMFTNHASKEINLKLIYVGPQLSGKAENLQYVYDRTEPDSKGKMLSLDTKTETTMFFDLLPKGVGEIRGYRVRIHLYSLSGQEEYAASTRLLLKHADGIVFVADCQRERLDANLEALERVKSALHDQGMDWSRVPKVFQLNKHRLPNALPAAELKKALGLTSEPTLLADTRDGSGVLDTLTAGVKELLSGLKENRVKEWVPSQEEKASGDRMTSRVQLVSHYGEFFGEGVHEYGPWEPSANAPPFYVMRHPPTKDRPYYTYATFGVSTSPQAAGGPEPRIELLAYSTDENDRVVERLVAVALMIKSASSEDTPFKTYDTVDLGDTTEPNSRFALVPPEEVPAFSSFPNRKREPQQLLFTQAVGAKKDADARVTFVKLLPLTSDEASFAAEKTTRALLKKMGSRPKHQGWGPVTEPATKQRDAASGTR
ncbi:suppressor of fused domain protein [Myxococcus sp. CA039A]|uniref:suppressor of fused domain protein n=1 Tax=Myxococcus sp. CA039A TaxID=2741737 RepID=UPI00157B5770|nr:suppressor of fused domain protein [Myxococcus sp. CA039A]NTX51658.1 suppressor of fused domain protein [Myxococcus sp. CA039A]